MAIAERPTRFNLADSALVDEADGEARAQVQADRLTLAEEWRRDAPASPQEIGRFYRDAEGIGPELDAWHATQDRQTTTEAVCHVARSIGARSALDVGCGAGHDLKALRAAGIAITVGVEPNFALRKQLLSEGYTVLGDVAAVKVEEADLLVCIDVLEHVPEPGAWLASWAGRAHPNAVLIETCSTYDLGTPLHLRENRGWHPGHTLETLGWSIIDRRGNLRVWQRLAPECGQRASILLCSYRAVAVPTVDSLLVLAQKGWRVVTKAGDGLISRSRAMVASRWWAETADDVFLMVDDDITFDYRVAEVLVAQCRAGHDVICAAYPVHNGKHLTIRMKQAGVIPFGPDGEPLEIDDAATGFMAVHRKVLDAMIPTLPLCHPHETWAFWPMFAPFCAERAGEMEYLSEDYAFCKRARELGFKVWLEPSLRIGHLSQVEINVGNMRAVHAAVGN